MPDPIDPAFSQMTVSMYSTSLDAASRLKLDGIFELDGKLVTKVLFLEAMIRTDFEDAAYEVIDGHQVIQYLVRKAFGLRIALQVAGWDANTSLSFSVVAAKAQLKGQSIQYYVETLGFPDWLEKEVMDAVGIGGLLNEQSFRKLRKVITQTLPSYLRRTPAKSPKLKQGQRPPLQFDEYRVPVESTVQTFDSARSIHFAMTHLARGDTLNQAKQALRDIFTLTRNADSDVIDYIYLKYAGLSPARASVTPPPDAVMVARRWLQFQS
jgi:hypothetical protein